MTYGGTAHLIIHNESCCSIILNNVYFKRYNFTILDPYIVLKENPSSQTRIVLNSRVPIV